MAFKLIFWLDSTHPYGRIDFAKFAGQSGKKQLEKRRQELQKLEEEEDKN
jgi:hypothetical protein